MTNTPDLLEKIRAKCIEVNPGIATHREPCQCKDHGLCPFKDHSRIGRPIRLADVLLAIDFVRPTKQSWFVRYDGMFFENRWNEWGPTWNLRQDSLEDQSPEVIAFISSILGVV